MAKKLAKEAERLKDMSEMVAATNAKRQLCLLRAEQYQGIAIKLMAAVENGDRRIEIRPT